MLNEINYFHKIKGNYYVLKPTNSTQSPESLVKTVIELKSGKLNWMLVLENGDKKTSKQIKDLKSDFIFTDYNEALLEAKERLLVKNFHEVEKDRKVLQSLIDKYNLGDEFLSIIETIFDLKVKHK